MAPEKRKKGFGGALVDRRLREARGLKIYEIRAITDRENMFRKRGFSEQLYVQKALFSRPSHNSNKFFGDFITRR